MNISASLDWDIKLQLRHKIGLIDQAHGFCRTYELTKWLYRKYRDDRIIFSTVDTPETLILLKDSSKGNLQIQSYFLPNLVAQNYLPSEDFLNHSLKQGVEVHFRDELELELHNSFDDFHRCLNRHGRDSLEDIKHKRLDEKRSKMNLQDLILAVSLSPFLSEADIVSLFLAEHATTTVLVLHDRMDNEAEPIALAVLFKFADGVIYLQNVKVDSSAELGLDHSFRLKILEFAIRKGFSKLITKDTDFLPLNMGGAVRNSRLSRISINNTKKAL